MESRPSAADLENIKAYQQTAWSLGDYASFGTAMQIMAELLCVAVDLRPGERVLDVATGAGNAALAAARRGAEVVGTDYVPQMLARAEARAAAEGLRVDFGVGDAEELPFPDASFDVALSTVGVMFAPDQERAAAQMLRVLRPGGRLGLACWTPEGFAGELGRLFGGYAPPTPGLLPPTLWGTEERLRELLGWGTERIDLERRHYEFCYRSTAHYLEVLKRQLGPTRRTFEGLDEGRRRSLARDVENLVRRFDRAGDGTMVVPSEYLQVVAVRNADPVAGPP